MRKNLLGSVAVSLLFLGSAQAQESRNAHGSESRSASTQENAGTRVCADLPGQTSGTRRFLRVGETIEISLRGDVAVGERIEGGDGSERLDRGERASGVDCEPVALDLHWSNGRNNGSNFNLTFLDSYKKPIYTKSFSGFLAGNLEFDLSSSDFQRVYASSMTVISVPATVTIQAVSPFAAPVSLSYAITRVARAPKARGKGEEGNRGTEEEQPRTSGEDGRQRGDGNERGGNEVVSIRNVVRLIGGSKLPVVQIELKTARPFPINEAPLQLQIGKKVFIDELSGEYTGRRLTLSLTPEMFAELKEGDEIVASFGKHDGNEAVDQGVWYFGKLVKKETANSKQ
jgi:hypothetical protein